MLLSPPPPLYHSFHLPESDRISELYKILVQYEKNIDFAKKKKTN